MAMQYEILAITPEDFSRPHDLALSPDGNTLLVTDVGHDRIRMLDPNTLKPIGDFGKDELSAPHDIAIDHQGRILVADSGNNRIAIYKWEAGRASFVEELSRGIFAPTGVTSSAKGIIYIGNSGRHNIVTFKGKTSTTQGVYGSRPLQNKRPHDIEMAEDGHLYVADAENNRIKVFDSQLKLLKILSGPRQYNFNEPKYLTTYKGKLYIADQYNNVIKIYDEKYKLLAQLPNEDDKNLHLNKPKGVLVNQDRIWISDTYHNRVIALRVVSFENKKPQAPIENAPTVMGSENKEDSPVKNKDGETTASPKNIGEEKIAPTAETLP